MRMVDLDYFPGTLIGMMIVWVEIIVFANFCIFLVASFIAFIQWDSHVYVTAAHMFNPMEHLWMRVVGIILLPISHFGWVARDGI